MYGRPYHSRVRTGHVMSTIVGYEFVSLVVFIRICVLHTALVLFGCISPDMPCVLHIHFGFVFFGSLYMQVIQGFIHDDHQGFI